MQRASILLLTVAALPGSLWAEPWRRHTIDDSSRGADGVRLADVNGDGRLDIATGWEEGGLIRAYLHPGPDEVRQRWPAVTVGRVRSPEDAVFADLDGDGAMDVVSCCEGANRTIYVHWAPREAAEYLDESRWVTEPVPATQGKQMWMFALPLQIDGRGGVDLVVGSKGEGATVGCLRSPAQPRRLADWTFAPLYRAGWIMSLAPCDMDGDGDTDVVVSDRKGANRGVLWLENPGADAVAEGRAWVEHRVGGAGHEVMFLDVADLDRDSLTDIVVATHSAELLLLRRVGRGSGEWETQAIANPYGLPNGKAVKVGDVNLDGRLDLVHDTEPGGDASLPGVAWLSYERSPTERQWNEHDISGPQGVKFDRLELIDLDEDGDLDVLGCEERHNLGVFWYENPHR